MRITIVGKSKNQKLTENLIREATRYYLNLLKVSEKIQNDLEIWIDFTQGLPQHTAGTSTPLLDNLSDQNPRQFEICLNPKIGYRPTLQTLAHEVVHLEQCATGRRYHYVRDSNLVKWDDDIVDENKSSYWDWPWEVEAHGKEVGMFIRFRKYLKGKNAK